jgi:FkbM family methyltransferase
MKNLTSTINSEIQDFRGDPASINLIAWITRLLPRGRGAFPRWVGKTFSSYFSKCYFTTRHGAKLAIPPSSLDLIIRTKIWNNSWEHWVFDTCQWVLPANGVVYDIGANVGYMAIELLHKFPHAKGILFEPQPLLDIAIQHSINLNHFNDRAKLPAVALSDCNGSAALHLFNHDGHASLARSTSYQNKIDVPTSTLDQAVLSSALPPPDVIKIDVEGHENTVFIGGANTLRAAKPSIIFECSDDIQFKNIQATLAGCGDYKFVKAIGSYRPVELVESFQSLAGKTDILAVERSRQNNLPAPLAALFNE